MDTTNLKPAKTVQTVEKNARKLADKPILQLFGRLGYAAKGVVYLIIGLLAILAASGNGGGTTDRKGAIETVYQQPFGQILLGLLIFGLICYALWNFVKAIADTEAKGHSAKGIAVRLFYVGIGGSYAILAFAALQLLLGSGNTGKSSDTNAKSWTAQLMEQPFGVWLVVIAALIVFGVAFYQFYKAFKAKFKEDLELGQMNAQAQEWTIRFGQFGLAARGVVFGVIAIFLIIAALQHNPDEARGLGGALQALAQQAYGQILLGVVALGLFAYGIFSLIESRYRRMVQLSPSKPNK